MRGASLPTARLPQEAKDCIYYIKNYSNMQMNKTDGCCACSHPSFRGAFPSLLPESVFLITIYYPKNCPEIWV